MKSAKKLIAVMLSLAMLIGFALPAYAIEGLDVTGKDYTITNPYETVDWSTWSAYKANLHAHTTYSDGQMLLSDVVEAYYALDYDILAVTDHGVLGTEWNKKAEMVPVIGYYAYINKYNTLTDQRYEQITTGSDRNGRGMLNVTTGIEMNCLVLNKNHVNGFFSDYGYAVEGFENDYETAVKGNSEAGGISFINHIGDWSNDSMTEPQKIQYFADIYKNYPSCVGMEIINRIDSVTKHDRELWDNILQVVIPEGRNVFAFSNDDSHVETDIGLSFEVFMLPENTQEALRTAMETGTFFACGRRARAELGDDFFADIRSPYPTVTNIAVNEETNTITVDAENYNNIQWVANGKVIAEGNTIDLNNYEDEVGCYVRFQIAGDGGMTFSQPFIVDDGTLADTDGTVFVPPVYPAEFQSIINVFASFKNTKIWFLLEKLFG